MRGDLDPVWHALSNRSRRHILDLLRQRPRATGELAAQSAHVSRFAVMQHLRVLERAGLVVSRRMGRRRLNFLNPVPIQQIYERWVSRYAGAWTEALVALKRTLEAAPTARRGGRRHRIH